MNYNLSNLSYIDNNFDLDALINTIRVNDWDLTDLTLEVVSWEKITCSKNFDMKIEHQRDLLKKRANNNGKELYNSWSFQIENIDINKQCIFVSKNIDYKTIISTRSNEDVYNNNDWKPTPNAFVVVNLLITQDEKIVLGKRDFYGDWTNNTYEIPGAFSNYNDIALGSLAKITQWKIYEDYDLDDKNTFIKTIPFWIYHFPRILETIFFSISKINVDAKNLQAKKYSDVLIIDNTYKWLEKIISMPVKLFHPPSRTVLQFFYENYSKAKNLFSKIEETFYK